MVIQQRCLDTRDWGRITHSEATAWKQYGRLQVLTCQSWQTNKIHRSPIAFRKWRSRTRARYTSTFWQQPALHSLQTGLPSWSRIGYHFASACCFARVCVFPVRDRFPTASNNQANSLRKGIVTLRPVPELHETCEPAFSIHQTAKDQHLWKLPVCPPKARACRLLWGNMQQHNTVLSRQDNRLTAENPRICAGERLMKESWLFDVVSWNVFHSHSFGCSNLQRLFRQARSDNHHGRPEALQTVEAGTPIVWTIQILICIKSQPNLWGLFRYFTIYDWETAGSVTRMAVSWPVAAFSLNMGRWARILNRV